jgi:hypothetical protein
LIATLTLNLDAADKLFLDLVIAHKKQAEKARAVLFGVPPAPRLPLPVREILEVLGKR